jgi:hypothetical protein
MGNLLFGIQQRNAAFDTVSLLVELATYGMPRISARMSRSKLEEIFKKRLKTRGIGL